MTKYTYMKDYIRSSIKKINAWLSKRGYGLYMSKLPTVEDEVDLDRKIVFISTRSSPQNQLYSLLHECGHIIIRSRKDYDTRYAAAIAYTEGNKKPSMRGLVEEIEEEILAWREGQMLAKKLEIFVEEQSYYRYSSRWVMSYIVRASVGREHLFPVTNDKEKKEKDKGLPIQLSLLDLIDKKDSSEDGA